MALSAGLGLKPEFFDEALRCTAEGLWFEVHAENYMAAGGPRRSWLHAIRSRFPVSLHGVGLSLAAGVVDEPHLERLAALATRVEPVLVSEHLSWSTRGGAYLPDLLPFPRTRAALDRMAANIGRVQDRLGRRIAIENPSHYLRIDGHEYDEIAFLSELSRRTGCGLLLDVNNVFVSANNLGFDAAQWLDAFPGDRVDEIHLAGHSADPALGEALLIDSHDAPVDEAVWSLYRRLIARIGPRPTLIERDGCLPSYGVLMGERSIAHAVLAEHSPPDGQPGAARCTRADCATPAIVVGGDSRTNDALSRAGGQQELDRFEDAFARALFAPPGFTDSDESIGTLTTQPGFAVYRNTVMRGLIDTLRANYPSVARIIGDSFFDALAACFARHTPPRQPCLVDYGDGFALFLEAVAPKGKLPLLADLARLDRLWTEAHLAADEPPLDAAVLGAITAEDLMRTVLVPHASARWARFDRHSAHSIWRLSREGADPRGSDDGSDARSSGNAVDERAVDECAGEPPASHAEGALLARPRDGVSSTELDRAACAFLDACAEGRALGHCAQAAYEANPDTDLTALLGRLLVQGAFARIERLPRSEEACA